MDKQAISKEKIKVRSIKTAEPSFFPPLSRRCFVIEKEKDPLLFPESGFLLLLGYFSGDDSFHICPRSGHKGRFPSDKIEQCSIYPVCQKSMVSNP